MYTEESIEVFLKEQGRLYDEPVAETVEEAEEFLEDCMAVEVKNIKEVRKYLDEAGADVSGMSDEELEEVCEVFTLPSGGYLIVEG
jgi:Ribonuclease G/E